MKSRARTLAVNAILIALMIIFSFLMKLPFALVATALFPLLILVVGAQLEGWWTAFVLSVVFGLCSMVGAYISPTPLAPIFQNPLISLLPRLLVGVLGLGVYKLCMYISSRIGAHRAIKDKVAKMISSALGGGFTAIFNTLLVLSSIWIAYHGQTIGGTAITIEFVTGLVSINFVVELIGSMILAPLLVLPLGKYLAHQKVQYVTDEDIASGELVQEDFFEEVDRGSDSTKEI